MASKSEMLPRNRVVAALDFRPVDTIPVRIFPAPGGLYDQGQRLVDLIMSCEHDFGDLSHVVLPEPPPEADFDPDGRYHATKTDEWGAVWEYRTFGIWGHPVARPLDDILRLDTWKPPAPPAAEGPEFHAALAAARTSRTRFFHMEFTGAIFETLRGVRRFEDVLMDIALDTPEINRLADMIMENMEGHVKRALALGADAIQFGDDFGTGTALMISPAAWRRFFKPRYERLCEPVKRAGKTVFFHSCGQIGAILDDLKAVGVDCIWPQLNIFDRPALVRRLRELRMAIELHPDRGDLMQRMTPDQVRSYVLQLVEDFDTPSGGSILYLEVDPGFPWPNVRALFDTAMELRRA